MTQKEKSLLSKDLCARLPYEIRVKDFNKPPILRIGILLAVGNLRGTEPVINYYPIHKTPKDYTYASISHIKPYLRPMSSMTEKEKVEIQDLYHQNTQEVFKDPSEIRGYRFYDISVVDWLNRNHFDYRGLIEKGLALPAPKDMYNN